MKLSEIQIGQIVKPKLGRKSSNYHTITKLKRAKVIGKGYMYNNNKPGVVLEIEEGEATKSWYAEYNFYGPGKTGVTYVNDSRGVKKTGRRIMLAIDCLELAGDADYEIF